MSTRPPDDNTPHHVSVNADAILYAPLECLREDILDRLTPGTPGAIVMAKMLYMLADALMHGIPVPDGTRQKVRDFTRDQAASRATVFLEFAEALDGCGPIISQGGL